MTFPTLPPGPLAAIPDRSLLDHARKLGRLGLSLTHRFLALLPEIERRRLHQRAGFTSITHFAARVAGLGAEAVKQARWLHARVGQIPTIWEALVHGRISWTKLRVVAAHVTEAEAPAWLERIRSLPRAGLEALVRERSRGAGRVLPPGSPPPPPLPIPRVKKTVEIDARTEADLDRVRVLFEKRLGRPVCWGEVLRLMATEIIDREKQAPGPETGPRTVTRVTKGGPLGLLEVVYTAAETGQSWMRTLRGLLPVPRPERVAGAPPPPRLAELHAAALARLDRGARTASIPTAVRRLLLARSGARCEFPGCHERLADLHHIRPLALGGSHHPDNLVGLCAVHHATAHAGGLILTGDRSTWRLRRLDEPLERSWVDVAVGRRSGRIPVDAPVEGVAGDPEAPSSLPAAGPAPDLSGRATRGQAQAQAQGR